MRESSQGMGERSGSAPESTGDDEVMRYLSALDTRRAATSSFPQPDRIVDDLVSGEMVQPADDPEGLRHQLGAHTPGSTANLEELEGGFVAGAKEYALRHGVGYEAWIQAGVDPAVLRRAGIDPEPD